MTTQAIDEVVSAARSRSRIQSIARLRNWAIAWLAVWFVGLLLTTSASAVSLQGQVELAPGLNLVGLPVDPALTLTVAALLTRLGGVDEVAALWRLNPTSGLFDRCGYDATGTPQGSGCAAPVNLGEGWLVEARHGTVIPYLVDLACPNLALRPGLNLVAFPCATAMTSYDLLPLLGDDIALAGVQGFDPTTGRWLTATYYNAQPAGDRFPIQPGRAYLVNAREPIGAFRLFGLNFSPYIDGQDPNLGSFIPEEQLLARMQIVRPYTRWIRTFGSTHGLEKSGAIAHGLRLQAALGAWISKDLAANEQEISNLIAAARAGEAELLIVGSEVLRRGELSPTDLIGYINRVRQAVPGIPVGYADIYGQILAHPDIIAASDVVLVNYYPYWEGVRVDVALAVIHTRHQQVLAAAQGKPVIVSEAGWPSAGNQIRNAVPSSENASFFFRNFVSWARANQVDYFYFEAFDESWKVRDEGPPGAHWGVWDKTGNLKPGMETVFNGTMMPDNWTLLGGPGKPAIEFTYVPPYGSSDDLQGQVWHIKPDDYKVAVYIYVPSGGGWWTKPRFDKPLTTIEFDGTWTCDITTGGRDETATRIAAFLVPNGYNPPLVGASGSLPAELINNAVASVEKTRAP